MLLALSAVAFAAGTSTDIELLHPTFSTGSIPGIDSSSHLAQGTLRVGLFVQYERDPLIVYSYGQEHGAVVSHRETNVVGVSWEVHERITLRGSLPVMAQWGTDVAAYGADGVGLGDVWLGASAVAGSVGPVNFGGHLDFALPSGKKSAYMGERYPRGVVGLLANTELGPVEFIGDLSVMFRAPVDTEMDFVLGTEVSFNTGLKYHLWPGRVALHLGALSRGGVAYLFQGGAENSLEVIGGAQYTIAERLLLDLGIGKGIADGYGTTEFRAFAGLTWVRVPPPKVVIRPPVRIAVVDIDDRPIIEDQDPEFFIEEFDPIEEEPVWEEEQLARITGKLIEIRDPIQFQFDTANILPESFPTFDAIAELLNQNPQIVSVVIEGHASEEGTFEYNFDLSNRRAGSVFQAMIKAGVHPSRLSYRGMGEVEPVTGGTDEASLAANRRVEFHIVRQLQPDEDLPAYQSQILLPWSGEPIQIELQERPDQAAEQEQPPPEPTQPSPVEERETLDPNEFLQEDDDEEQP
jgi:outer membrane protein OmpA-like peptidoglycan-associated protein